jgi:hypothetical protein
VKTIATKEGTAVGKQGRIHSLEREVFRCCNQLCSDQCRNRSIDDYCEGAEVKLHQTFGCAVQT